VARVPASRRPATKSARTKPIAGDRRAEIREKARERSQSRGAGARGIAKKRANEANRGGFLNFPPQDFSRLRKPVIRWTTGALRAASEGRREVGLLAPEGRWSIAGGANPWTSKASRAFPTSPDGAIETTIPIGFPSSLADSRTKDPLASGSQGLAPPAIDHRPSGASGYSPARRPLREMEWTGWSGGPGGGHRILGRVSRAVCWEGNTLPRSPRAWRRLGGRVLPSRPTAIFSRGQKDDWRRPGAKKRRTKPIAPAGNPRRHDRGSP